MCGIAGIFDCRGRGETDRRLLRRMTDLLEHRGPDGDGFYHAPGVGLGHRRLAIIDLAGGDQPLFNEDRTVCVVFNGEIYNFQELMAELRRSGMSSARRCDTEVIVHAWEEWGEGCLERFNGMFAFALLDERRETLFLARDRLGEKPLYYSFLADGRLLFASELKSILCSPAVDRRLDPHAIEEFFAYRLYPRPALDLSRRQKARAGALSPRPPRRGAAGTAGLLGSAVSSTALAIRREEAEEELIARLRRSVRMRMIADVPLGAFLSGGVDSSAVVAMMAGLRPRPVSTFSISFGASGFDKSALCRGGRQALPHRSSRQGRRPGFASTCSTVWRQVYDEPFGDSSAMPTLRVCAMARENVTVALSGDGGDEVFAGYRRYRWHCFEERLRRRAAGAPARPSVRAPRRRSIQSSTGRRGRCAPRRP